MDVVRVLGGVDVHGPAVGGGPLCEVLVGVVDEPLVVDPLDVDPLSAPADDLLREIEEHLGLAGVDHRLLHPVLRLLDAHSGELATDGLHPAGVVTVLVHLLLGVDELGVPGLGDAHAVDDVLSGEVAVALHLYDGDRDDAVDELPGEPVLGLHAGIGLDRLQ